MYIWKGVPYDIDSVFKWKDGHVYFFKGKVFWKFDDRHMRVANENPSLSAPFWMGCTSHPLGPANPTDDKESKSKLTSASSSNILIIPSMLMNYIMLMIIFY